MLGDLDGDLADNYAPSVVVLTTEWNMCGHDGPRRLARVLRTYDPDTSHQHGPIWVAGELGMLPWTLNGPDDLTYHGADTFLVRDGRIWTQTSHYLSPHGGLTDDTRTSASGPSNDLAMTQWWPWLLPRCGQRPATASGSTAQELYDAAIKQHVSPALRGLGLRGSAGRYHLPSASHWLLLGLQKSAYSDRAEVRFTVNLTVISRRVWEAKRAELSHLNTRPSASIIYGPWAAHARIGGHKPGGVDKWWRISDHGEPVAQVVDDLLDHIKRCALPWLRSMTTSD